MVSQKFNDLISNSRKLMHAFPLVWTAVHDNIEFESNRKFRSIEWKSSDTSPAFVQFLKEHQDTLQHLKFSGTPTAESLSLFRNLLELVAENLESLEFQTNPSIDESQPIAFDKLRTLTLKRSSEDLGPSMFLFHAAKLKEIKCLTYMSRLSELNVSKWAQFFESQSQLEQLELIDFKLFQDRVMRNVTFKLTHFTVSGLFRGGDSWNVSLIEFLRSQSSSLRVLHLISAKINKPLIELILQMDLCCLHLFSCELDWADVAISNESITKLILDSSKPEGHNRCIRNILDCCTNAESISFRGTDLTLDAYIKLALEMPKLTHLCLGGFREPLKVVSFQTLTQLEIDSQHFKAQKESTFLLVLANKHLKKIAINEDYLEDREFVNFLNGPNVMAGRIEYKKFKEFCD